MVFAVLLAVFAVGAAIGALFATHAAPGDRDGAEVASGALLAPPQASPVQNARPSEPLPTSQPAVAHRRPRPAGKAPAPTPPPATSKPAEPRPNPADAGSAPSAPAPARPVAPAETGGGSYTVRPGDSLWPIARKQLDARSSNAAVARRVKHLVDLNLEDRIASGDPDLLTAGERLRLP
jgi:nucleoid-associated protein YgaU